MNKNKYPLLLLLIISIFSLSIVLDCIPDLADIDPPVVNISYPANGTSVSGTVQIVVSASDDNKVKEVQIFIDGIKILTSGKDFVSYSWDTTPFADNSEHYISAIALDESDNIGTAPVVAVTVNPSDNTPPVVNIINPINGQTVFGNINIVTEATDNVGVEKVELYIDGLAVDTAFNRPYDYLWKTNSNDIGEHTIFARAFDSSSNASISPVITVTVDTTNVIPSVNIRNPLDGQIVSGIVNIVAEATDDDGVERVEFYIDGLLEQTVSSPPYYYFWNTNQVKAGDHNIYAKAFDLNSNSGVSPAITVTVDTTIDDTPPVVNIVNPPNGQLVSGNVNIVAEASDDDGVERVEFYIDGVFDQTVTTPPYNYLWNTNLVKAGNHNIYAKAVDLNNNSGVSPAITVTVDTIIDNIPPIVNIINPPNGQLVSGNVNIVAEASDDNGVERVEFYVDGSLGQTVTTPPYNYLWNTNTVTAGNHNLYAKAIDLNNNSAVSPVITVTVDSTIDNTPPAVNIVNPPNGQIVSGNVNIVAEATDDNGVERVEFYVDGVLGQTVTTPPYNYLWNTSLVPAGNHNLYAKAFDLNNNSTISPIITVTIAADVTPPVVNIVNPPNGQIVSGTVNIFAEATDNTQVDRVEFFIDGLLENTASSPPFVYPWNTALADTGIHNIFARAYDLSNNSAVSPVITVTVVQTALINNTNPQVKIINPSRNGLIFSTSETKSIPIEVKVPNYIVIQKAEFYVDGTLQKVVSNAVNNKLKYDWDFKGFADGLLHTIFVKVYDNSLSTGADMVVVRVYP